MNKIFFYLLMFLAVSAKGQTSESLVGKWKFKDINNPGTLDSAKLANLKKAFGGLELDLRADKSYAAILFKKEDGTWSYDDSLKVLILKTDKGENRINIMNVNSKTFVLEFDKGKGVVLEKVLPE